MLQTKIAKLTPEQEALMPLYREKWRKIVFSTEPIDRQKASEAVKAAYAVICKSEPKVIFCSNPYKGLYFVNLIQSQKLLTLQLRNQLIMSLLDQLRGQ